MDTFSRSWQSRGLSGFGKQWLKSQTWGLATSWSETAAIQAMRWSRWAPQRVRRTRGNTGNTVTKYENRWWQIVLQYFIQNEWCWTFKTSAAGCGFRTAPVTHTRAAKIMKMTPARLIKKRAPPAWGPATSAWRTACGWIGACAVTQGIIGSSWLVGPWPKSQRSWSSQC